MFVAQLCSVFHLSVIMCSSLENLLSPRSSWGLLTPDCLSDSFRLSVYHPSSQPASHFIYLYVYLPIYFYICMYIYRDQDNSVGIATGYGLDGPGIVQTGPGARPASGTMGTGSFLGVKRPGRCADHPSLLVSRSRKSRTIPLPPVWAFVSVRVPLPSPYL
jgi:hypothetical protein